MLAAAAVGALGVVGFAPAVGAQGKLDARYEVTLAGVPIGRGAWFIDISDTAVEKGVTGIARNLDRLVSKGKLSSADKDAALARIKHSTSYDALAPADLVIEAATEDL